MMRIPWVLAILLAAAGGGCGPTRLFTRSGDDGIRAESKSVAERDATPAREVSESVAPVSEAAHPDAERSMSEERPDSSRFASLPVSEHLARAERALTAHRLSDARPHLAAILQQQPSHPRAHHLLAIIADLEGRFADAEHHYLAALQSDRLNAQIIGDLGYSYLLQGRLALAEQYLNQARTLDPSHTNATRNLALLYSRRGDREAARRTLSAILPPDELEAALAQLFPGSPPANPPDVMASHARPPGTATGLTAESLSAIPTAELLEAADRLAASNASATLDSADPIAGTSHPHLPAGSQEMPSGTMLPSADSPGMSPHEATAAATGRTAAEDALLSGLPPVVPMPQSGATIASTRSSALRNAPGPADRRWPPATWPPETDTFTTGAATPASSEVASSAATRANTGVTYLLPRRPEPPAALRQLPPSAPVRSPMPPTVASSSGPERTANAVGTDSNGGVAMTSATQSSSGGSRIVAWSNYNGHSIPAGPADGSDASVPAGTSVPPVSNASLATPRASPGSSSLWNGDQLPQTERRLPTSFDYPPQGGPLYAAPGYATPAAEPEPASDEPAASLPERRLPRFADPREAASSTAMTAPTGSPESYDAERRRSDQLYQQQIDQTYGRSPATYIPSPTSAIPAPTYEVPPYRPQSSPETGKSPGTSWPAGSPPAVVPNAPNTPIAPYPYNRTQSGTVIPEPYAAQRRSAAPTSAANAAPGTSSDAARAYDGATPKIIPRY